MEGGCFVLGSSIRFSLQMVCFHFALGRTRSMCEVGFEVVPLSESGNAEGIVKNEHRLWHFGDILPLLPRRC